jgi:hypothetical protein
VDDTDILPMAEMLERHKKLSVSELMDNMGQEGRDTMAILAEILHSMPHRHSLLLMALLFGSMCADAEMEHPERSYQDRVDLFLVHSEIAYREAVQFIKDNHIYNKPKDLH